MVSKWARKSRWWLSPFLNQGHFICRVTRAIQKNTNKKRQKHLQSRPCGFITYFYFVRRQRSTISTLALGALYFHVTWRLKVPLPLSLQCYDRETHPVGLPAHSALTSACTSWLLLTVTRCAALMTAVIHCIYWPDAQTESIICLLLLSACFVLLPVLITVYVHRALNTHQYTQWQLRGQISARVISTL